MESFTIETKASGKLLYFGDIAAWTIALWLLAGIAWLAQVFVTTCIVFHTWHWLSRKEKEKNGDTYEWRKVQPQPSEQWPTRGGQD